MKKIFIIITLCIFSFTQAKAICMNDDDLMDYAIMSYMETSWTLMKACIERVPDFNYKTYDDSQVSSSKHTSKS
mgnify:CR=1 FL=1